MTPFRRFPGHHDQPICSCGEDFHPQRKAFAIGGSSSFLGEDGIILTSFDTGRLNYGIRYLIVGEIFFENQHDLLSLCPANRHCYLACLPWIYRDVITDLSDKQSLVILKRLTGRSNIERFVRTLTLVGPGKMHYENYDHQTADSPCSGMRQAPA
ncbi:uncharacterized protein M421DRAFT_318434 [Didymella exigua CBS 183.55]|uniref:Uncharacterized protein n=1 Tax=Didymella exigua CBS 183.55 TaxID=1150837 RepID=A0A6A5RZL4_9PLEO|nr:uncharacterized protein M421DRAFT_318434 [Didymella exigua CBS 183.55]KAF1931696.1 hypothetical protein M421DRAFT_318434 [Didymella exigua CBS 183.55]